MTDAYDPEKDGARMSYKNDMSYGDYLNMDSLIAAQRPLSNAHDEMLFIIQHQTSELWMRLILHELSAARPLIANGKHNQAFKMLARVARIFEQLNNAWDVLRTMTPSDYSHFRDDLGASSGFQSHQYRLIEYMLGNRNLNMLQVHEHRPDLHAKLTAELQKLVDLEDYFRRWRFNHVTTVERVIGFRRGTGGTSGVKYLRRMLEVELFPELWHMRGGL